MSFESVVAIAELGELFGTNCVKIALYQQRFDVGPSPADSGSFLLHGALIVLRRKTTPRAEMLQG